MEGKNRILLAVDGSPQAMEAVRYVSYLFPSDRTHIVLYNIGYETSKLYSDLDANPLYRSKIADIKRWMAEDRISMGSFMETAEKTLHNAGYAKEDVEIKVQQKGLGVVDDIIRETYNPYNAIVVGRTGTSRFKDALMKSVAFHIVSKIKHIPVIVVGGYPSSDKILIAFDGSIGAMRGIFSVAQLLGGTNCEILLYSLLVPGNAFWVSDKEALLYEKITNQHNCNMDLMTPRFNEAKDILNKGGIIPENISTKVDMIETNRARNIVSAADKGWYCSIVVGRRGQISSFEEFFVSRISEKILKLGEKHAIWII